MHQKRIKIIIASIVVLLIIGFCVAWSLSLSKKTPTQSSHPSKYGIKHKKINLKNLPPVSKRVLVKFKPSVPQDVIDETLKKYNAKIISKTEAIHLTVLEVPKGQEDETITKLQEDGIVEYAERSRYGSYNFVPNDKGYGDQWPLPIIHASEAWDVTKGKGVKVGIVDSGIAVNNPELAGQIAAARDMNPIRNDLTDTVDHGTGVAGVVAAVTNNGSSLAGICPECKIVFAKNLGEVILYSEEDVEEIPPGSSLSAKFKDCDIPPVFPCKQQGPSLEMTTQAIPWLIDQGVKVINFSFGTDPAAKAQSFQDAINYAWDKGAIVFVASSQDSNPFEPTVDLTQDEWQTYSHVAIISASNKDDKKPYWMGYGSWVTLTAPGVEVPLLSGDPQDIKDGYFDTFDSGSSFATPLVAGVAALVWSTPYGTSNDAVLKRLCDTADQIPQTGVFWKCGRVNAARAVGATMLTPTPTPVSDVQLDLVPQKILVRFKPDATQADIDDLLQKYQAKIIAKTDQISMTVLEVPKGQEDSAVQGLAKESKVVYAERNYLGDYHLIPNDEFYEYQWAHVKTNLPEAWDVTQGNGIKVGIADAGVDVNHPDLIGKIVASLDLAGTQSVSGSGLFDDHGTAVSGVIAAATNNGKYIAGVCPQCSLVYAKVNETTENIPEYDYRPSIEYTAAAIPWLVDQGAKVINLSMGFNYSSQALLDATNYAWDKGAIVFAAVQQDNPNFPKSDFTQPNFPGRNPHVVTVTASNRNDQKALNMAYGPWVQIAAPGIFVAGLNGEKDPGGIAAADQTGTSIASAFASGIAALIWSTPYGTSNEAVVQRLCDTADKIPGTGASWACGRVNAARAVGSFSCLGAACITPTNTVSSEPTPTIISKPTSSIVHPTKVPSPQQQQPNKGLLQLIIQLIIIIFLAIIGRS